MTTQTQTLSQHFYEHLKGLPQDEIQKLLAATKAKLSTKRLHFYKPYAKQKAFHAAGLTHRERCFMAGNQLGKTLAGGSEMAMHLTGRYPDWWEGRRFDRPVKFWAAGITGESTRDNPQRILMGRTEDGYGTGTIPGDSIIETVKAVGVPDLLDSVVVRHVSGGQSRLAFKFYEKGRAKWQGETLDGVWFDEEPPPDIYSEGLTRTQATGGFAYLTLTPLLGMSDIAMLFYPKPKTDQRHLTRMTIEEAEHYTAEERAIIIASYPEHEQDARAKGIPMLGSGRIFPIAEEAIKCEPFEIPDTWARIGGMDFGWDHPFAAVDLAHDRDADIVYVTKAHSVREQDPIYHAAALKAWGEDLPWSWPRDGRRQTLEGAGKALADQYEAQGLNMLYTHAQFEDGSVSVESGIMEMLGRMRTGRLKVFKNLEDWFAEFRVYHRKDGIVVKERDDLLSATRYGIMMLREAEVLSQRETVLYRNSPMRRGSWAGS